MLLFAIVCWAPFHVKTTRKFIGISHLFSHFHSERASGSRSLTPEMSNAAIIWSFLHIYCIQISRSKRESFFFFSFHRKERRVRLFAHDAFVLVSNAIVGRNNAKKERKIIIQDKTTILHSMATKQKHKAKMTRHREKEEEKNEEEKWLFIYWVRICVCVYVFAHTVTFPYRLNWPSFVWSVDATIQTNENQANERTKIKYNVQAVANYAVKKCNTGHEWQREREWVSEWNERKYVHTNWWLIFYTILYIPISWHQGSTMKMEFKCNETESIYWEINAKAWATNNWLTKNRERNWISFKIQFGYDFFRSKMKRRIFILAQFWGSFVWFDYCRIFCCSFFNFNRVFRFKNGFSRKHWIKKKRIFQWKNKLKTESEQNWCKKRISSKNAPIFNRIHCQNAVFWIKIRLKLGNCPALMSFWSVYAVCVRSE